MKLCSFTGRLVAVFFLRYWTLDREKPAALVPIDVMKPMAALPAMPWKPSDESPHEIPPATSAPPVALMR